AALQAAADKLSPALIRERLDYWTLLLGPKFSVKERKRINLSRFYSISQIEYCRNFIFKRHFPIHQLFERSSELRLTRLTSDKHQPFRVLPGPLAQRSRALSAPAAHRSADHHRLGALSRHQDPRDAHHPADGSPLARRNARRWLDGQADP